MVRQIMTRSKTPCDKMETNVMDPVSTMENKQHIDTNKSEQSVAKKEENLFNKIAMLEDKVQTSIAERLQYEESIKNKKQKYQKALSMKTRQIKMFKIKMQKLKKLQIQEKKKIECKIKILKKKIEEEKDIHKNILTVLSEICTTDLITRFKEVYEPLKNSGYKFKVKDIIPFLQIKSMISGQKQKSSSASSSASLVYDTMDEMDKESEEDMDKESEEDMDKESEEDMDKESEEEKKETSEKE